MRLVIYYDFEFDGNILEFLNLREDKKKKKKNNTHITMT